MRAPRKSEMLRLQTQYKTDARIAEALGVEEYLVSYWRRKKKLPRHSAPKFSREQISELWERYGDDFRCGRELNISKAAYYGWRRKYGLLDRPSVLKLEQLELRLPGTDLPAAPVPTAARTATQKILDRVRNEPGRDSGAPDWRLRSNPEWPEEFLALTPAPDFETPRSRPIPEALALGSIEHPLWICEEMGQFAWQLIESRVVLPGQLVTGPPGVGNSLGGVGCLYQSDADYDRPHRTVRVEVTRRLGPGSDVDDIILSLYSHGIHNDWQDAVVEFVGGPVERFSIDRKARLCALAVHAGARAALCAFDEVTRRHYGRLLRNRYPHCHPDRTASYDGEHFIEGRALHSLAAALDEHGRIRSVSAPEIKTGGVLIGPHALPFEIEEVATALKGRRLAKGITLFVCPATPTVYRHAQRKGWHDTVIDAGGSVLDVGLINRLGIQGLLNLAAGPGRTVYVTGPFYAAIGTSAVQTYLAGVRTILSQLELVF